MSEVFVVRNQLGHYWGKSKSWVDGTEPKAVLRCKHEDEAVNTLVELSSKDFELRGEVIAVTLSERGDPEVEPSEHLLPKEPPPSKAPEAGQPEQGSADDAGDATTDDTQQAASAAAGSEHP